MRTKRTDGSWGHSCGYYLKAGGILSFCASMKVTRPTAGPVTSEVIQSLTRPGSTPLTIRGTQTTQLDGTPGWPRMWLATERLIVTIVLVGSNLPAGGELGRQHWERAATAIASRLPS